MRGVVFVGRMSVLCLVLCGIVAPVVAKGTTFAGANSAPVRSRKKLSDFSMEEIKRAHSRFVRRMKEGSYTDEASQAVPPSPSSSTETLGGAKRRSTSQSTTSIPAERIFDGNKAELNEFGYYTRIAYFSEEAEDGIVFGCGGSIISTEFVLTAAHCFTPFLSDNPTLDDVAGVVVGYICDDDSDESGDIQNCAQEFDAVDAKGLIWDRRYDDGSLLFDLALIRLERPTLVRHAPIIPDDGTTFDSLIVGDVATMIGFGNMNPLGEIPDFLQEVDVHLLSTNTCEEEWQIDMQGATVCVDSSPRGSYACRGDSGGPVIVRRNGVDVAIGVVSFGDPPFFGPKFTLTLYSCGASSVTGEALRPDVMARVSAGMDWIREFVCVEADFPSSRPAWCNATAVEEEPVADPPVEDQNSSSCVDTDGTYINPKGKARDCPWLEKQTQKGKTVKVIRACVKRGAAAICPKTCGRC